MNHHRTLQLHIIHRRIAAPEIALAKHSNIMLARLPAEFGFPDVGSFARVVRAAVPTPSPSPRREPAPVRRWGSRARIDDATRARVKVLVKTGETSARVAQLLQISVTSVQNIKRTYGLVRTRPQRA